MDLQELPTGPPPTYGPPSCWARHSQGQLSSQETVPLTVHFNWVRRVPAAPDALKWHLNDPASLTQALMVKGPMEPGSYFIEPVGYLNPDEFNGAENRLISSIVANGISVIGFSSSWDKKSDDLHPAIAGYWPINTTKLNQILWRYQPC